MRGDDCALYRAQASSFTDFFEDGSSFASSGERHVLIVAASAGGVGFWCIFYFTIAILRLEIHAMDAPITNYYERAAKFDELAVSAVAGCSCKLGGVKLGAALSRCNGKAFKPEDAAPIRIGASTAVTTVDGGPPVHGNPYLAAFIAVTHAVSDLYASGAHPRYISSFTQIADDVDDLALHGLLTGCRDASEAIGAEVVTGHTIKASHTVLAYSVIGELSGGPILSKAGARQSDNIFLSKPLGTGMLIRANADNLISEESEEALVKWMMMSNLQAMHAARRANASCVTDVTGFGLVGHLAEILDGFGARISVKDIPTLSDVRYFIREIGGSAWTESNVDYARSTHLVDLPDAETAILVGDPQTSGGLLVTAHPDKAACLLEAGFVRIGAVSAGNLIEFN